MCLYPRIMKNKKYLPNKKNHKRPPALKDPRVKYVPIACGVCMECKRAKSREWQVRLNEEIKVNKGWFVTLTFNNENLEKFKQETQDDNQIATKAIRLFLERVTIFPLL